MLTCFYFLNNEDLWTLSDGLKKVLEKNREITEKYDKMENYMLDILMRYREQLSKEESKKLEKKPEIKEKQEQLKIVNNEKKEENVKKFVF